MKKENPKTLTECLFELGNDFDKGGWEEFKNMEEDDAVTSCHHGTGRNMRNNWELWDDTKPLTQWFNRLGITHADDMSGIILTSFHRQVNEKPIDLDAQVEACIEYWKDPEKGIIKNLEGTDVKIVCKTIKFKKTGD